jgi:hypothetical protein
LGAEVSACCGLPPRSCACAQPSVKRVHYNCALYSANVVVSETGPALQVMDAGRVRADGLNSELRYAAQFHCKAKTACCSSRTHQGRGASVGCYIKSCRRVFHYACARKQGCQFGMGSGYEIACPAHRTDGCTGASDDSAPEEGDDAEEAPAAPAEGEDGAAAAGDAIEEGDAAAGWEGDWEPSPAAMPDEDAEFAAAAATDAAAVGAPGFFMLCSDISAVYGTAEAVPVPVVGPTVDAAMPPRFRYVTQREGVERVAGAHWRESAIGCTCDPAGCGCGARSTAQCEHVQQFDEDFPDAVDIAKRSMRGRLPYAPYPVGVHRVCMLSNDSTAPLHECNARCTCGPGCKARVMQHGLRARLFLRPARKHPGWAVHAAAFIPAGAFIAEYVGEVVGGQEAESRGQQQDREGVSYLFSIDSHVEAGASVADVITLDASHVGNVTRFVNHSCDPNCRIRSVMWESSDPRLAHLALYAMRDIDPGEELTYHYRYQVKKGSKTGIKCKCGASTCRGWLVTF